MGSWRTNRGRSLAALAAGALAAVVFGVGTAGADEPAPDLRANIVVGAGPGSVGGHVKVFDGQVSTLLQSFLSFSGFTGGVDVAAGDVDGDGFTDIVVGAGAGATGGHVKAFSGRDGSLLRSFLSFPGFAGGVFVAAGDVNGDGFADIVVAAGQGAPGGHVKAFSGRDGSLLYSFLSFPGFTGGEDVAAGDVDGDGLADIVVGAGSGPAGGHVKAFSGRDLSLLHSFFSFPGFAGGVVVAAGDVNGDGSADIVVGTGPGAPGGHVKVFDGNTGALLRSFFSFPGFTGGVDVAAGDVNGDGFADIVVGGGAGATGGHVKVFDGNTGALIQSFLSFPTFSGGIRVAAIPVAQSGAPDSDGDGIPDASDPDTIAAVVLDLPLTAFSATGHPRATLARLDGVEALIRVGDVDEAVAELEALRRRFDGCPATPSSPESADRNDWVVDCDAQRAVRAAIDGVLTSLSSN